MVRPSETNLQSSVSLPALRENEPLRPYTTFKIGGPARYFAGVADADQARAALEFARRQTMPLFVLGGGSNILVSDRGFNGMVLHPAMKGIEVAHEEGDNVHLRAQGGEAWDGVVAHTVDHHWWGIENLSHIPGQCGAALVQNIGAYGQQLSDVLESAEVLEISSGKVQTLGPTDCGLAYRRSIFNSACKGEYLILGLTLRLSKRPQPKLEYADVQFYFRERGTQEPSQAEIRQAMISIRDGKFPYPREERGGNAGSFFKNPSLSIDQFEALEAWIGARLGEARRSQLSELRARGGGSGYIRIPAAMLISACGLKGFELGRAQVNLTQPLVILNLGGATAEDVLRLAGHIRRTVFRETGVQLELEPELVGFAPDELERYFA